MHAYGHSRPLDIISRLHGLFESFLSEYLKTHVNVRRCPRRLNRRIRMACNCAAPCAASMAHAIPVVQAPLAQKGRGAGGSQPRILSCVHGPICSGLQSTPDSYISDSSRNCAGEPWQSKPHPYTPGVLHRLLAYRRPGMCQASACSSSRLQRITLFDRNKTRHLLCTRACASCKQELPGLS
jgi:hypothetical protein